MKKEFSVEAKASIREQYENGVSLLTLQGEHNCSYSPIRRAIIEAGGKIRGQGRMPKVKVKPVLKEKLELLAKLTGKPVNDEVLKTIVDYAMKHNDGRTFRKIDRRYDYDGVFSQFRREHLESSYYIMGRLWRYVYRYFTVSHAIHHTDYGVAPEDIAICLKVLEDPANVAKAVEDRKVPAIQRIKNWVDEVGDYMYLPNERGVTKVVQDCENTLNAIVNSKLRFIYMYDPAYSSADLVSFLRVIAYRVAIKYDWEKSEGSFAYLKCLNYTKRSLWNAATLLIKENTSDDYRRLERVDNEERVYQVTTVSIDSSDEEWRELRRRLGEEADTSIEVSDLIDKVSDAKLRTFLRLEFEEVPEFSKFVMHETGTSENDLYRENYKKWRELAQRFSGILTKKDRVAYKRQVLKEFGMWDPAKIIRKSA